MSGGNLTVEREILIDFRRVNDKDAAMLEWAIAARDRLKIVHIAHRIKGASLSIGATRLATISESIENAGRANDLTTVELEIGVFQTELKRLNTYLDAV